MQLAFIGLGTMGGGMALNLIRAGHDVAVHDLRQASADRHVAAGARWAASPADAANGAQAVFTSVPGPREMREVGATLLEAMAPDAAWFDLSTNSPSVVREVHRRFADRGIALLDAPVSGGPAGANAGKLAIYVGGDKAVFERHKPLLDAIGDQVLHVGDIGAGNVAKLVHNCASITMRMMIAEVFSLGVKGGMDPLELWHAVRQGAIGRSRTFDRIGDQYLQDRYEPASFALKLAHKDLTLALDLGRELAVPMHYAEQAMKDFQAALDRGWGDRDSRSPMQIQNERAGVHIQVAADDVNKTLARA
ncbi:MAG TPA: NAD(P)-dependent oxidoreductase [Variovorax sp.]|nr:NAD(P)-dependent oxidoreductase [Variovorax sp.]